MSGDKIINRTGLRNNPDITMRVFKIMVINLSKNLVEKVDNMHEELQQRHENCKKESHGKAGNLKT